MTKTFHPEKLDVKAFAKAGGHLAGHDTLLKYERLAQEAQGLHPDLRVDWHADAELRPDAGAGGIQGFQPWLHLYAQATLPMLCQRCLTSVDVPLQIESSFRFVADEATAEAMDDQVEEDLLAISREFDLHSLIEDELLMALPVVPYHDECPEPVVLASSDEDFEAACAEKPNPFAALASLRVRPSA